MTHASGKFIPPPAPRASSSSTATRTPIPIVTFIRGQPAPVAVDGPRIPAPRSMPRPGPIAPAPTSQGQIPDLIPGAIPIPEYNAQRASLPSHLVGIPRPAPAPEPARFSTDLKRKFSTVRKAEVPSFKPPEVRLTTGAKADFFGSAGSGGGVKRTRSGGEGEEPSPAKAPRSAEVDEERTPRSSPASAASRAGAGFHTAGHGGGGPPKHGGMSAEAADKLKGVLFRSKPKRRAVGQ